MGRRAQQISIAIGMFEVRKISVKLNAYSPSQLSKSAKALEKVVFPAAGSPVSTRRRDLAPESITIHVHAMSLASTIF